MEWSDQQAAALDAVNQWIKKGDAPIFRLFGYAGTGKTTLAKHLAQGVDGEVLFGAFTGKAAQVLRQKGCPGASTIHAMIYRPDSRDDDDEAESDVPAFVINRDSPAHDADLIIIDECSMVDEMLGSDLLSFGKPVLVLGDPAQLPPVSGGGYFTDDEPDMMLTEIHRQARDNPIIRLAQDVREGNTLDYGDYDTVKVIHRRDLETDKVLQADQVLVGRNVTRQRYNNRLRELKSFDSPYPQVGDKLVCLRNNHQKGLLNGGIWLVDKVTSRTGKDIKMRVSPEIGHELSGRVPLKVPKALFEEHGGEIPWTVRKQGDSFDYGYALTVHKSQGSQWNDVMLFDESWAFRDHRHRWLYTGITRAAETLTIVR
ncbi:MULTISPECIES: ATP-dependent DNA helicase [Cohaesibacter]|uniref:ATP-dependent DNA helicase n=1 Tax=Cohaesibacter TaxID=655352 RepID=UPI000DE886A1|nr:MULTISPECIES: AAA family ATPase [Cohaesibacter]TLP43833.1 ATP-binding protein [Cohaesibacter sp. CAU 1516]